jgi:plastocyanin
MSPKLKILGLVAAPLALAACGPSGGGSATAPQPVATAASTAAAAADKPGPLTLIIQDHKFIPSEITVPANTAVAIEVTNKDPLAEEFESADLKIEKVIAGGDTGTVRLHPLEPGHYTFVGEYHSATAKGVVIAK